MKRQGKKNLKTERQLQLRFYEQMVLAYETMSEQERADLENFERQKRKPSSEWPGWRRHIGRVA